MADEPTGADGADGEDRLARLRGGLAAERELLLSLSSVLAGLRASARAEEARLDLEAGWSRVEHALREEP